MFEKKRPWQGTALGVIDIIAIVLAFISSFAMIFMQGVMLQMMGRVGSLPPEASGMMPGFMSSGLGSTVGAMMLIFVALFIFMAIGAFKGQKWSPIASLILGALGLLSFFSAIGSGFNGGMVLSLAINLFTIYCAYVCVKDPFYQSK